MEVLPPSSERRTPHLENAIQLLQRRRTRIVATVGPSSWDKRTLRRLIECGANVLRLNMSHGDHEGHGRTIGRIREIANDLEKPVAILADLAGPKIRAGTFVNGEIELIDGSEVVVTTRDVKGEEGLIPSRYPALAQDVGEGDRILLDDGKLELRVESSRGQEIRCRVIHGGTLRDNKGINLPGVQISAPSLTDKDKADALFAIREKVDFLGLSFVRRSSDVTDLRELIQDSPQKVRIISKIEKPEAVKDIESILAASDGVMVARGDLGVELAPEEVPVAQDLLVDHARSTGKPVIVATQMLESMMHTVRPSRAEASDVAYAVKSGADAVMLSGETAAGEHPVLAVQMMDRIIRSTEGYLWKQGAFGSIGKRRRKTGVLPVGQALARAVAVLSRDLDVRMILVVSRTGSTASVISAARPAAPVVAVSPSARTCRAMNLFWGMVPRHIPKVQDLAVSALARQQALEIGLAEKGDSVLVVRGFHWDPAKSEPTVSVVTV